MDYRPRYRPEWLPLDKGLEIFSWLLLCACWMYILIQFFSLPNSIPIHFNAEGVADAHGHKYTLLLLPLIITGVFILLHVFAQRPWQFNYIVKVTEQNYKALYTSYVRVLRILKAVLVAFLLYICIQIIQGARSGSASLNPWVIAILIAGLILPPLVVLIKSLKLKT